MSAPMTTTADDAAEARWRRMGYYNDDTDSLIACDRSMNYGYCHDRGCITHGCWITRSEGGNKAAAMKDRSVIDANDMPDDLPKAWARAQRKWENVLHAPPETMSECVAEMDEAMRRLADTLRTSGVSR